MESTIPDDKNPTWARLLAARPIDAGTTAAALFESGAGVFGALPHLAVLRAQGEDAARFLQGQLTCDVMEVDAARSRLGAWCNPKGRVSVLFRLLAHPSGIDLVLPLSQLEETRKRLGMYVLRADAALAAAPGLLSVWASGKACDEVLRAHFGDLPEVTDGVVDAGGSRLVRLSGGARASYLGVMTSEALEPLWNALGDSPATAVGPEAFELDRIRAAEPSVQPETNGAFVPQMLNLELLDGISFTKGCYIGQEVVARTQHLGKLKRRMFRARIEGGSTRAAAGDPIYGDADSGSQSVGTVVRAATDPSGGCELLTVLRLDAADAGGLHLHQILGPALELLDIPYPLTRGAGS